MAVVQFVWLVVLWLVVLGGLLFWVVDWFWVWFEFCVLIAVGCYRLWLVCLWLFACYFRYIWLGDLLLSGGLLVVVVLDCCGVVLLCL